MSSDKATHFSVGKDGELRFRKRVFVSMENGLRKENHLRRERKLLIKVVEGGVVGRMNLPIKFSSRAYMHKASTGFLTKLCAFFGKLYFLSKFFLQHPRKP